MAKSGTARVRATRVFYFRDPTGRVRKRTRARTLGDPKYAIFATPDERSWGLYRVTEHDAELLRVVKELLAMGQRAYVTVPIEPPPVQTATRR